MIERSQENLEILNKIKAGLKETCSKYRFDFIEHKDLRSLINDMMNTVLKYHPESHITNEINKTQFPDALIISMLQDDGIGITSIHELKEVTQDWNYDKEKYIAHMYTNFVLKKPVQAKRYIITLKIPKALLI